MARRYLRSGNKACFAPAERPPWIEDAWSRHFVVVGKRNPSEEKGVEM
jgi:hypothetical protein